MDASQKKKLLAEAQTSVARVIPLIQQDLHQTEIGLAQTRADLKFNLDTAEQMVLRSIQERHTRRLHELSHLQGSPYFFRCDVAFAGEKAATIYFSKFSFPEQSIYSWVSPASVIRFEKPGPVTYTVPSKSTTRRGMLERKDQFLIVDGTIRFMATESMIAERELIHQEYLSQRKNSFILPEIVEQMERAQDAVIRAHHQGSFLIAGPAGSGKTTLALHRIAYLAQSPDTMNLFSSEHTIVFVQDARTKEYFSSLLPQLGIEGVSITTFAEWAFERLNISGYEFVSRYGQSEQEQDEYEYSKHRAIQQIPSMPYRSGIDSLLAQLYEPFFTAEQKKLLAQQKKAKVLDRFDLTALLKMYLQTNRQFQAKQITYKQAKVGKLKEIVKYVPLRYRLMVIDEAENYLPEQLQILRSCIAKETEAIIYVGDLAQQTQLCTIRDWDAAGEQFSRERKVVLQKVYRSTKQILTYIRSLGYQVEIPEQLRDGPEVIEKAVTTSQDVITYLAAQIKPKNDTVVGILAKSEHDLTELKRHFNGYENVQILTINEAQGVEFDRVFFISLDKPSIAIANYADPALAKERNAVNRDLVYVALTRAMNELHVLGSLAI